MQIEQEGLRHCGCHRVGCIAAAEVGALVHAQLIGALLRVLLTLAVTYPVSEQSKRILTLHSHHMVIGEKGYRSCMR